MVTETVTRCDICNNRCGKAGVVRLFSVSVYSRKDDKDVRDAIDVCEDCLTADMKSAFAKQQEGCGC